MGVGRGALFPLDFEIFCKKDYFLRFEWEKTNFTTFAPPGKILEKSSSGPPLENIIPTPMATCLSGLCHM